MTGIYQIRNVLNGKRYVGSAVDIDARWYLHVWQLEKGVHHCRYLQRAWNKHRQNAFAFEILEECAVADLLGREQIHINSYPPKTLYNVCRVVHSRIGVKASVETKAKLSASHKGKKHTSESRAKMSSARKGKLHSTDHCANLAKSQKGKKHTPESRAKMSSSGKNRSAEANANIRKGRWGKDAK